ncbi:amidohydrolase family protein [Balneola sp. MJW-20]|uniref:amidohydrolase family protein n=1 Tax=Gracilimonas aurantiaca TaxID=3234185 RepID=UPI003465A783
MKLHLRKSIFRLLALLPLLCISLGLSAQSDPSGESPATRTYAITNATIVQAAGDTLMNATIVFKNGLIRSLGTDVSIPGDAEVIDGTDMFVYPGFIDGMSYTGAVRPDSPERPDDLFTPDPPNDYAGITPEEQVTSQLSLEENSIEDLREIGFTVSHTVPYGRMLPGSGALLLLNHAEHPDEMLIQDNVSMYTQFVGAPGAYPGNTLGIMAKFRDLYRNATYSRQHAEMYASNPAGMERPTRDRVMEAFYPVVSNEKPIFYNASSSLEARRAIRLKNDLGFTLVLGNLEEGWGMIDELKSSDIKVFMSLELPDEPENADEDEEVTEEVRELEERRMEFYTKHVSQFGEMEKAGIKFGFSSIDANSRDIHDNLRTMIANGLSETAALNALTRDAAELLGISEITGSLSEGMIANAVVANGPIFDEDTQIRMVFADGDKFDYEIRERRSGGNGNGDATATSGIEGTWRYTIESPQGEQGGTMVIEKDGDDYTGTLTSDDGAPDQEMENLTFVNNSLSFDFSFDGGGQTITIVVVGTVTGTEYDAEASISAFNVSFPLTAYKEDPQ